MDLGRVLHVGVDSSLKDVLVVFGLGMFAIGHPSQVNVEEGRTGYRQLNTFFSLICEDVHMTKVEEADVPQIDRLGVQHLFRTHRQCDTNWLAKVSHGPVISDDSLIP